MRSDLPESEGCEGEEDCDTVMCGPWMMGGQQVGDLPDALLTTARLARTRFPPRLSCTPTARPSSTMICSCTHPSHTHTHPDLSKQQTTNTHQPHQGAPLCLCYVPPPRAR
jgi:hypothetical protein